MKNITLSLLILLMPTVATPGLNELAHDNLKIDGCNISSSILYPVESNSEIFDVLRADFMSQCLNRKI